MLEVGVGFVHHVPECRNYDPSVDLLSLSTHFPRRAKPLISQLLQVLLFLRDHGVLAVAHVIIDLLSNLSIFHFSLVDCLARL